MIRLVIVALAAVSVAAVTSEANPAGAGGVGAGSNAVEHIVVVVEQNHTYDAYFGAYKGGDGAYKGGGRVSQASVNRESVVARPFRAADFDLYRPAEGTPALATGNAAAMAAYHDGAMDSFVRAQERRGKPAQLPMLYADESAVPALWSVADSYVLFDRYFSSVPGSTLPNMLSLFTGVTDGYAEGDHDALVRFATSDTPTIFDQLTESDVSWRYYSGRFAAIDAGQVRDGSYLRSEADTPQVLYSSPVLALPRFWEEPRRSNLATQDDFYQDAATGSLPAVSVISPLPSDQPLTSLEGSQQRLLSVLNTIQKGPEWPTTAVFVIWDDWGGWYDHVAPPTDSGAMLGFRVPALLMSPLVRQGYVSHTAYDHRSVLAFIARRFNLSPLTPAVASANNFDDAFEGSPVPDERGIIRLSQLPDTPVGTDEQNALTQTVYAVVVGLAAGVTLGWLAWRWRRARRLRRRST